MGTVNKTGLVVMSKVVTLPSIGDNQDPSSLEDGGGDDGVVSNSSWSVTDGVDMEEHPEEQQQPTAESSSDSYLILNKKCVSCCSLTP